jgi:phosphate starvation-inducible PhoH-like protein
LTGREVRLRLPEGRAAQDALGEQDALLDAVQRELAATVATRGGELVIDGADAHLAARLLRDLFTLAQGGRAVTRGDVVYGARQLKKDPEASLRDMLSDVLLTTTSGKAVAPRTLGQKRYVDAIRRHDLTFAIGPAGTGKTYLAVAMAVLSLRARQVQRLVLTRPAVEAGERLGFLPGDIAAKVDPYLRPLYDALYEMAGPDRVERYLERNVIEVAPLAFMRGRTLNDSFVILDEAQNTTPEQLKMFLTRFGFGSKAVVTGDVTQIDLPRDRTSGLLHARRILEGTPGIAFLTLEKEDVVRHELVQRIVEAYEAHERE